MKKIERLLPLNKELEQAAFRAMLEGKLSVKSLRQGELSKIGRLIHKAVQKIGPSTYKQLYLTATEVFDADPVACRAYLKEVQKSDFPNIQSVLQALQHKQVINNLVNEAGTQIVDGTYSLLSLKAILDANPIKSKLVPLSESMEDETGPPKGIPLPCLPSITEACGGLYGVWVIGGEPAAGKSTLALQVSLLSTEHRPVLYYDFEQGTGVIRWHVHKALEGDKKRIHIATQRLFVRHSLNTLEADLDGIGEPCVVVVDSVQKVANSVTYRRESLEAWVHKLEALKRFGHHVILVSEKNRGTYGNASLQGYKESGEIEYAADTAFDILRCDDSDDVELYITKNRHYKKRGLLTTLQRVNSWWFTEPRRKGRRIE